MVDLGVAHPVALPYVHNISIPTHQKREDYRRTAEGGVLDK